LSFDVAGKGRLSAMLHDGGTKRRSKHDFGAAFTPFGPAKWQFVTNSWWPIMIVSSYCQKLFDRSRMGSNNLQIYEQY
jgi:hypothetical protein